MNSLVCYFRCVIQEHLSLSLKERLKSFRRVRPLKADGAAQPSKKHKRLSESQPELSAYDGEDTVSYKRHIAAMLSEYKKLTPSQELVRQLMKLTFTKRRQGILAAPQTANNILGEFPFLASFEHVCQHTFYLAVVCT